MTTKILYLFPDTNLFVQCRPLDELDWASWQQFEEVHLIVTRPVQSELDRQKSQGNARLCRRARAACSQFRDIILGDVGHKTVRDCNPAVKLLIKPELKPSTELSSRLDYKRCDDELVGTVAAFIHEHPAVDARILTDDTGPMLSAKMVGIGVVPVPDDWLLAPEISDAEKKIRALEGELARLKSTEPDFQIDFVDNDDKAIQKVEIEQLVYEALADNEIAELKARIVQRFPMATDFSPRPAANRVPGLASLLMGVGEYLGDPSEGDIARYRDEYPAWLKRCDQALHGLHHALQHQPTFCFVVTNRGTRPAKDALVTISAQGEFAIMPSPSRDDDNDDNVARQTPELPRPPAVPSSRVRSALTTLQALMPTNFPPSGGAFERQIVPSIRSASSRRDPNGFYWKPRRPEEPGAKFSLECEQWRHGVGPERFNVELQFDKDDGLLGGALECRLHAENLSKPVTHRIPVRINIKRARAYDAAKLMVERLEIPED